MGWLKKLFCIDLEPVATEQDINELKARITVLEYKVALLLDRPIPPMDLSHLEEVPDETDS